VTSTDVLATIVLVLQLHLCLLVDVFAGYSPHVVLLHCKDVKRLTLDPMLSQLVALITKLQFRCSCPDVHLDNFSYPTKAEFNNCFIIHSKYFLRSNL